MEYNHFFQNLGTEYDDLKFCIIEYYIKEERSNRERWTMKRLKKISNVSDINDAQLNKFELSDLLSGKWCDITKWYEFLCLNSEENEPHYLFHYTIETDEWSIIYELKYFLLEFIYNEKLELNEIKIQKL